MANNEPKHEARTLEDCVLSRHSIRFFTLRDVPEQLIRDCVSLAQHAPSNSNIQNWRLHLARGAARDRIAQNLMAEARQHGPRIGGIPDSFQHYRSAMGHKLYGADGYNVGRDEPDEKKERTLRNYEFFGAPVCGIITMSDQLSPMDAMCVGMFVQTFVLALTERGLGTCLQQSVTGYPELVRKEFGIPDDEVLLSGIAIGYPDEHPVNDLVMARDSIDVQMKLHQE